MSRVVGIMPVWQRYKLTDAVLEFYRRELPGVKFILIGDEPQHASIAKKYGHTFVTCRNDDLTEKWQEGVAAACMHGYPDMTILIGSDDLLSRKFMLHNVDQIKNKNALFIGTKDYYFYDTVNQQLKYWAGYTNTRAGETVGAGRSFSKEFMKIVRGKLFQGLGTDDALNQQKIMEVQESYPERMVVFKMQDKGIIGIGIKTELQATAIENLDLSLGDETLISSNFDDEFHRTLKNAK